LEHCTFNKGCDMNEPTNSPLNYTLHDAAVDAWRTVAVSPVAFAMITNY